MRQSALAVWLAGQPAERVVTAAREDASLTHPNPVAQVLLFAILGSWFVVFGEGTRARAC